MEGRIRVRQGLIRQDETRPSDDELDTIIDLGELDFDGMMASAAHANIRRDIDAEHLSKIWRISLDDAERTLGVTTQSCARKENPLANAACAIMNVMTALIFIILIVSRLHAFFLVVPVCSFLHEMTREQLHEVR